MGLVWPAYLNASATKLRSSIPVHITHNSDKPPPGSQEDTVGGGRGVRAVGYILFGGLKSISPLTQDSTCGDSIQLFASMSRFNFASMKMSYLLEQWIRDSQRSR